MQVYISHLACTSELSTKCIEVTDEQEKTEHRFRTHQPGFLIPVAAPRTPVPESITQASCEQISPARGFGSAMSLPIPRHSTTATTQSSDRKSLLCIRTAAVVAGSAWAVYCANSWTREVEVDAQRSGQENTRGKRREQKGWNIVRECE